MSTQTEPKVHSPNALALTEEDRATLAANAPRAGWCLASGLIHHMGGCWQWVGQRTEGGFWVRWGVPFSLSC